MNEQICQRFKVILIGDSGVGKTSLAIRQCEKTFTFLVSPTIGSSHMRTKVCVDNEEVELMIWDTAGQESLAPLVPMYMRGAAVCIIVASCLNIESCEHIKDWIEVVNQSDSNPRMILAFNKFDLVEDEDSTLQEIKSKYSFGINNIFYTSAKNGDNVDILFNQVAIEALDVSVTEIKTTKESVNLMDSEPRRGSCKC